MRRLAKGCIRPFFVVLWVIPAFLALETWSYYHWQRILAGNEWVIEVEATEYLQPPRIRPLPDKMIESLKFFPPAPLERDRFEPRTIRPSTPFESAEERRIRYEKFDALSPQLREIDAVLNFECVVDLNTDGDYVADYGHFKLLQLEHLEAYRWGSAFDALSDEARDTLIRTARATLARDGNPKPETIDLAPDLEATLVRIANKTPLLRAFIRPKEHPAVRPWVPEELPEDTPWAVPFYRYRPNMRQERSIMADAIDTDDLGFRTPQVVKPKPPGIYRILCFGGSTTEEGNLDSATYPAVLQRLLREYIGNDRIEVINAGVCSATTNTHLAATADFLSYEPDLLLAYEGTNDIVAYLVLHGIAVRSALQTTADSSTFVRRNLPNVLYPPMTNFHRHLDYYTFSQLDAMRLLMENHGTQMMLCSLDGPDLKLCNAKEMEYFDYSLTRLEGACSRYSFWDDLLEEYNQSLREWCSNRGVGYVPLAENLAAGVEVYPDICHMYDEGIELKARIIFEITKDWIRDAAARAAEAAEQPTKDRPLN